MTTVKIGPVKREDLPRSGIVLVLGDDLSGKSTTASDIAIRSRAITNRPNVYVTSTSPVAPNANSTYDDIFSKRYFALDECVVDAILDVASFRSQGAVVFIDDTFAIHDFTTPPFQKFIQAAKTNPQLNLLIVLAMKFENADILLCTKNDRGVATFDPNLIDLCLIHPSRQERVAPSIYGHFFRNLFPEEQSFLKVYQKIGEMSFTALARTPSKKIAFYRTRPERVKFKYEESR